MKKQTVLVTGACGFLGSHLVDQLVQRTVVRATDLQTADCRFLNSEAEFLPSDLRKPQSLHQAVKKVDIVFHAASLFRYSASWGDLYAVNVEGTQHLCQAAIKAGVSKLILVSSSGVYGVPRSLPIREDDPKNPSNLYERSKWEQEQITEKICDQKLDLIVLRPSPIYGPRNRYGLFTILQMIAKGQLPILPENLNTLVPLVHVVDVAQSAIHLATYPDAVGETYNIADDSTYRKHALFTYIAPLLNTKIYHTHLPLPRFILKTLAGWSEWKARNITHREPQIERATIDLMYQAYWFSNAKLKATGYQLRYPDCRIGLKDTIDWYKLHKWL